MISSAFMNAFAPSWVKSSVKKLKAGLGAADRKIMRKVSLWKDPQRISTQPNVEGESEILRRLSPLQVVLE